jgi:hypothetical protein
VVASRQSLLRAYRTPPVELVAGQLQRAYYAYAVLLAAELNPARTAFFVSTPFQAGSGVLSRPGGLAVDTSPAAQVLLESALLRGRVAAPPGTKIDAWYEYGPVDGETRRTTVQHLLGGEPTPGARLRKLSPRARWSYRLVARIAGTRTEVEGQARAFTLTSPTSRALPLIVLGAVEAGRNGVRVQAVVACTGSTRVALEARRLARAGQTAESDYRTVYSIRRPCGPEGQDVFVTFARPVARGSYAARLVASSSGRESVRKLFFTVR